MPRVKRGTTTHKRHAAVLERAKGFRNGRRKLIKRATEALLHSGMNAYIDRRTKKRTARSAWIVTINAGVREHGLTYSTFINKLQASGHTINRKTMADLARTNKPAFDALVKSVAK